MTLRPLTEFHKQHVNGQFGKFIKWAKQSATYLAEYLFIML